MSLLLLPSPNASPEMNRTAGKVKRELLIKVTSLETHSVVGYLQLPRYQMGFSEETSADVQ